MTFLFRFLLIRIIIRYTTNRSPETRTVRPTSKRSPFHLNPSRTVNPTPPRETRAPSRPPRAISRALKVPRSRCTRGVPWRSVPFRDVPFHRAPRRCRARVARVTFRGAPFLFHSVALFHSIASRLEGAALALHAWRSVALRSIPWRCSIPSHRASKVPRSRCTHASEWSVRATSRVSETRPPTAYKKGVV